jgi:hypothetical protein
MLFPTGKGEYMKKLSAIIIVILLLGLAGSTAYAAETGAAPGAAAAPAKEDERLPIHKQEKWQFFLSPYVWIPGMNIRANINGHTASVNAGWWDVANEIFHGNAIGVMGRAEVWKGRWGFTLDSYFTYLGVNVTDSAGKTVLVGRHPVLHVPIRAHLTGDIKAIVRLGNLDVGPRFLIGTVPLCAGQALPVLAFEALGGARMNFYDQYLRLGVDGTSVGPIFIRTPGNSFVSNSDRSYVEPYLGGRLSLWLSPRSVITLRGTVGGFTWVADNNLDADIELAYGYRVSQCTYLYAAYRARYDQFNMSRDIANLSVSAWFHGPVMGAVFTF